MRGIEVKHVFVLILINIRNFHCFFTPVHEKTLLRFIKNILRNTMTYVLENIDLYYSVFTKDVATVFYGTGAKNSGIPDVHM